MSTLKELAQQILTEKNNKIISGNIKNSTQIFDVTGNFTSDADATASDILKDKTAYVNGEKITGTYEASGGSGDVKLFDTIANMQADSDPHEGDMAIVYRSEIQSIEENSIFSSCTFPSTVTLDTAFTGNAYGSFRSVDPNVFDASANVSPSRFRFQGYGDKEIRIEYSSSDGITYTRTDGGDETIDFGIDIKFEAMMEPWNDVFGQFMKIGGNYFEGLFEYKNVQDYNQIKYIDEVSFENNTLTYSYNKYLDITPYKNVIQEQAEAFFENENQLTLVKDEDNIIIYLSKTTEGNGARSEVFLYDGVLHIGLMTNISNLQNFIVRKIVINSDGTIVSSVDLTYQGLNNNTSYVDTMPNTIGYILIRSSDCQAIQTDINNITSSGDWTGKSENPDYKWVYKYVMTKNQLDATADYVYEKTFYGKNGVENGTLGDVDNSYKDVSADVLVDILTTYESFEPIIITNNSTDKAKLRSLHVLPSKQDGTALVDISALNLSSLFSTDYNLKAAYNIDVSNSPNLAYMFQSAKNLKYVSFKNSEKINYLGGTFGGTGLIRGPEMNTINVTTFSSTFSLCGNLESVPNYNTSNAVYMSSTFSSCRKLKSVPNFNTSNAVYMDGMFSQCDSLESVPNFDTRNLTNINDMFSGCLNLQTVPNLNLSKVTTMQAAFTGCVNLQTIPNFNTSNVVNMQMAFRGCESLNNIPNLNISKANWVGELFYNCKSLTEVPNFNTTKVESCDRMFDGCSNLVSVPSFNMSSRCNNAIMMFANCPNLSNESLNNIMYMCTKMTGLYSSKKNFSYIGITRDQANICKNLSNYSAYKSAGWSDYN